MCWLRRCWVGFGWVWSFELLEVQERRKQEDEDKKLGNRLKVCAV
jgi:hypothetical protein